MTLTRDRAYRAGMSLRRLMNDDGFATAVELLRQDYTNRIMTSVYSDTAGREECYKKIVALDDLIGVMTTLAMTVEQQALSDDDEE